MPPYRLLINLELTSSNLLGFCTLSAVEQSRNNTTFGTTAPSPKYPELPVAYTHSTHVNTSNTETGCTIHTQIPSANFFLYHLRKYFNCVQYFLKTNLPYFTSDKMTLNAPSPRKLRHFEFIPDSRLNGTSPFHHVFQKLRPSLLSTNSQSTDRGMSDITTDQSSSCSTYTNLSKPKC